MDFRMGALIIDVDGQEVTIPAAELVLSERNLRTLLVNLEDENNGVSRMTDFGIYLTIRAEPNEVHYKDRHAGLMDEKTEEALLASELGDDTLLVIPEDFGTNMN